MDQRGSGTFHADISSYMVDDQQEEGQGRESGLDINISRMYDIKIRTPSWLIQAVMGFL